MRDPCRKQIGKVEMYVILWKFEVHPEKVDAFVAAYKSEGAWRNYSHRRKATLVRSCCVPLMAMVEHNS